MGVAILLHPASPHARSSSWQELATLLSLTHSLDTLPPTHTRATLHPRSLDYPGIGPEHSYLRDAKRAEYYAVTDDEALDGFQRLSQLEGIIPALETSHAIAYLEVCVGGCCAEKACLPASG